MRTGSATNGSKANRLEVDPQTGDKDITAVSRADENSFFSHLEKAGYSAGSIRKQVASVKAMFDIGFHK